MNFTRLDWTVLVVTLLLIFVYGIYKSRTTRNLDGYFLNDRAMPWWFVLLGIMGTQAGAITFLTAPGQAYTDGMRFVQYYFGQPIAMVIICIAFVPVFRRLKVYTAYEYLEQRFDSKTRLLTAFLFLISRGLSTGISLVAPSIVLYSMLGWNFYLTNIIMGGLMIIYTVTGGAKAVAHTQKLQFIVIYGAMFLAAVWAVKSLPEDIGLTDALHIGGKSGKMNVITTGFTQEGFNWKDQYNLLSGIIGGLFLGLSYFGTDQSQVRGFLTARSDSESKLGLLMNGLVKVPLQFGMLLIGILIFTFYQFNKAPAYFNLAKENQVKASVHAPEYAAAVQVYDELHVRKQQTLNNLTEAIRADNETAVDALRQQLRANEQEDKKQRDSIVRIIQKVDPATDAKDTNYIFLRFVGDYLPAGLVGLIITIIFLASWSSIASALNALANTTMVDFHRKFSKETLTAEKEYRWSKWYSFLWGLFIILAAQFAYNLGNSLIEAVNILGSWFYGTILGIFLVALYIKRIGGHAVFIAAILAECLVIAIYFAKIVGFLWLNLIGAVAVIVLSCVLQLFFKKRLAVSDKG